MKGYLVAAIALFVIWLFAFVFAERPDDKVKQDAWHRFKKRFRAGLLYHLFAARTKERLKKKMLILYLLAVGSMLTGTDMLVSGVFKSYVPLNHMQKVHGTLVSFIPRRSGCGEAVIEANGNRRTYSICYERSELTKLSKSVGQQVMAWTDQEASLYTGKENWINQVQYGNEIVLKYRVTSLDQFEKIRRGTIFLVLFIYALSIVGWLCVALVNRKDYGAWGNKGEKL